MKLTRSATALALALALGTGSIAAASSEPLSGFSSEPVATRSLPIEGPKSPVQWFARRVSQMRAKHPHGHFEATGYHYLADPETGDVVTGQQFRLSGPNIFNPCVYLASFSVEKKFGAGSCRGN